MISLILEGAFIPVHDAIDAGRIPGAVVGWAAKIGAPDRLNRPDE